jgi:hypothetical protein
MCRRSRQQVWVLLLVLVVALLATACGGGDEETTSSSTAATVAPSGGAVPDAPTEVQIGPPDGEPVADEYISTTPDTPEEFVSALTEGSPIVLLFYVTGGADDAVVMESLERLEPSFSRFEFFRYDYSLPDKYGDLSTLLAVTYPPELILIDRSGIIRQRWTGYVDEGSLNQGLVNLSRE